jgi:7,8-dihydropterin-6-yl-methyl-4-(beta-D-ribofuranosyl)aminobenzene 5'-phosphate synthase
LANTLAYARRLSGGEPIHTVLGGFHLKRLSHGDLDAAISALEEAGTREILAGHCTGEKAVRYLAAHSQAKVDALHVGFESRRAGSSKS